MIRFLNQRSKWVSRASPGNPASFRNP
jgi:hypothetical protein